MDNLNSLRAAATNLDESDIVAIVNSAREKPGLIPLWVGEGDLPTPQFIIDAANESLANGETFYTWQRGIPDLRQALADYHEQIFALANNPERFFVTGSGMQAIQLTLQALVGEGDEVVMTTPCWPNIHAATQVAGGRPVHVELDFSSNGWSLDIDKLFDSVTERTAAIFINSPSNPTGWVADEPTLRQILSFARKRGLWIVADEVYSRFVYDEMAYPKGRAPSFYDIMDEDDRVILVNTFSKNWAMTGWRAGWISASPEIGQVFENLIQYSTSGVPSFIQRAAVSALQKGEPFMEMQRQRAHENRDRLCGALSQTGRVRLAVPQGAFYLFFAIEGRRDTKSLALQIIEEANVGLSPGTGFYTGGSGFLRLCFMRNPQQIDEATERLVNWVERL